MSWDYALGAEVVGDSFDYLSNIPGGFTYSLGDTQPGEMLVLVVGSYTDGSGVASITDSVGNTWVSDPTTKIQSAGRTQSWTEIWWVPAGVGGNVEVTVATSGASYAYWQVWGGRYPHSEGLTAYLVTAAASGPSSATTSHSSGVTSGEAAAGDLVIGAATSTADNLDLAPSDGKTPRVAMGPTSLMSGSVSDVLSASAGTQSATFSTDSSEWVGTIVAVFRETDEVPTAPMSVLAGSPGAGTQTASAAHVAGKTTDVLLGFVVNKPYTVTPTCDGGWPLVVTETSGTVSNSASSGSVRSTVFAIYDPAPTSAGSETFRISGGSPTLANTLRFTSGLLIEPPIGLSLSDTSETGTAVSASGAVAADEIVAGDWLAFVVGIKDDSPNHNSRALNIPGCTLSTITWLTKYTTTFGNDGGMYVGYCQVLDGASTGSNATYTATSTTSGASSTAVAMVRIREIPPVPSEPQTYDRTAADSTSVSDGATRKVVREVSVADTTALADSSTRTASRARVVGDSAPAVDDGTRFGSAFARDAQETLALADAAVRQVPYRVRAGADSASAVDAGTAARTFRRSAQDMTASVVDAPAIEVALGRTAVDSTAVGDVADREGTFAVKVSAADAAPTSDASTRLQALARYNPRRAQ